MKILRLAQSRVLLWASERGSDVPFEVSKVVNQPLQPKCPTAPRCPGEVMQAADGWPAGSKADAPPKTGGALWLDPAERPRGSCAYHFEVRGDCLQTRNQLALEAALFRPSEVVLTKRLLEALGYRVDEETLDTTKSDPRILDAHGPIGARHQVKLMRSPSAGQVVLVRRLPSRVGSANPDQRTPPSGTRTGTPFTVLPAGSNP